MTKQKNFRLSEDAVNKLSILTQKRNFASETITVEKAIEEMYGSLDVEQPKQPEGIELLRPLLGEELYDKHVAYLEERKRERETLEDVFRALIYDQFVYYTKEEYIAKIAKDQPTRFLPSQIPTCNYRVVASDGTWYCDGKKIVPEVCLARQERYSYMAKVKDTPKIKCRPKEKNPQKPPIIQRPPYTPKAEQKIYCLKDGGLYVSLSKCEKCEGKCESYRKQFPNKTFEPEKPEEPAPIKKKGSPLDDFDPTKSIDICLNPLIMRKQYSFKCSICGTADPQKKKACDEIVEELTSSPIAYADFIKALNEKKKRLKEKGERGVIGCYEKLREEDIDFLL